MAGTNQRGRPKGSGIDDSAWLGAIANMIEKDPELRPTTAIKKLGIENPSVIRRLRDKYNSVSPSTACAGEDDDEERERGGAKRGVFEASAQSMALAGPRDHVKRSERPARREGQAADRQSRSETSQPALSATFSSADPFTALIAAQAAFVNVFVSQQAQILTELAANPMVRVWFQSQVVASELVLTSSRLHRRARA